MIILVDPLRTKGDGEDIMANTRSKKQRLTHTQRGHNVTHKQTRTKVALLFIQ
jgi:hypothetical protein